MLSQRSDLQMFAGIGSNLHNKQITFLLVAIDIHIFSQHLHFHSLKEAGFHGRQYNYFYEWVLQSLLWLDNDIITTVGPCLTSDQHRSSVLFLFTRRVCRFRNSLHCRCECSGSVSSFLVPFYPWSIFVIHSCLYVSTRQQGFRYTRPELSHTTLCTSLRSLMLIYTPVCAAVDAARGPLSDVWCLSVSMNFPSLQRLLSSWSPFLPLYPVLKNKPLISVLLPPIRSFSFFLVPFQNYAEMSDRHQDSGQTHIWVHRRLS